MKKIYIAFVLSLFIGGITAQNEFALSEQLFSRLNINPSATGNSENVNIFSTTRAQWIGLDDKSGPITTLLNAHWFISKISSGLGATFYYDKIGLSTSTINAKLAYAYQVDLSKSVLMSFGLSAGIINKRLDPTQHIIRSGNDDGLYELQNKLYFDMGFGFEIVHKYVLGGFSIQHLIGTWDPKKITSITISPAYHAYVRGKFDLAPKWTLTPSFLFMNSAQLFNYELNAIVFYDKMFWGGLGYRFNSNIMTFTIGVEYEWFRVGYSYDLGVGKVYSLNNNTHELMLSFNIPTKKLSAAEKKALEQEKKIAKKEKEAAKKAKKKK